MTVGLHVPRPAALYGKQIGITRLATSAAVTSATVADLTVNLAVTVDIPAGYGVNVQAFLPACLKNVVAGTATFYLVEDGTTTFQQVSVTAAINDLFDVPIMESRPAQTSTVTRTYKVQAKDPTSPTGSVSIFAPDLAAPRYTQPFIRVVLC